MKVIGIVFFFVFSVGFVRPEIGDACNSDSECDSDNREECILPSPTGGSTQSNAFTEAATGSTYFTDATNDATEPATKPTTEPPVTFQPYTCQCKSGFHESTVNDTLCAKDLTAEDDFKCELQIDCAGIDYPTTDYETDFDANPVCDTFCRCGKKSDDKTWLVVMYEDEATCFHEAIENQGTLECTYNEECEYLSLSTDGNAVCTKNACECTTDGFELYNHVKSWSCELAIGGPCEKDADCYKTEESFCSIEKGDAVGSCQCKSGYKGAEREFICTPVSSAAPLMSSLAMVLAALLLSK